MTILQWVSIAMLVVAFALSIWRHINIGITMYAGALVLGIADGLTSREILSAFPTSLIVLIIGVTMLFAHAERSGAISWLVDSAFKLVRGKKGLIPWVGFVVGAGIATVGSFPTAPIALLLPIMSSISQHYKISYPLLAVTCVLASNAGGFSPLSPAGATILTIADQQDVHYSAWALYAVVMVLHVILVMVLLLIN